MIGKKIQSHVKNRNQHLIFVGKFELKFLQWQATECHDFAKQYVQRIASNATIFCDHNEEQCANL